MSDWFNSEACSDCACMPVCSIFNATGGVARCKFRVPIPDKGEWIYKPFQGDESVWLFHCSKCDAPSAQKHPFCRGCGAEMKMEDKE
jgi:hypothetical protein